MRIHFIAVCGTGMGSLAGLMRAAGHDVTGSDVAFDPPMGPALEKWGVRCVRGFDPAHLDPAPDRVVVGNVCRRDNPEARAAIDRGLRVTTMPHLLAEEALAGTMPIVVAGTHGKTTTTALCAWLLDAAGQRPGFLIGGLPRNFPESFRCPARCCRRLPVAGDAGVATNGSVGVAAEGPRATALGSGPSGSRLEAAASGPEPLRPGLAPPPPFVVEGDEYDTAFFEKTPKFWHYRPEIAVVSSIEHDHVDIYPDEASYVAAFREFVARVPPAGLVVAAAWDPIVVRVVREAARARVAWYALARDETAGVSPEWVAAPAAVEHDLQTFDLYAGGVLAGRFAMHQVGEHSVRNAVAAVAAVAAGRGVDLRAAARALLGFHGVRRRQELVAEAAGLRVYDDFAHHPRAVAATVSALRAKHPQGRLWAAYEPRSATACRALHQQAYARAFDAADVVLLAPLGRTNVPEPERLDLGRLASDLAGRGRRVVLAASIDEIVAEVTRGSRGGDTLVAMSNGTFGGLVGRIVEALRARG